MGPKAIRFPSRTNGQSTCNSAKVQILNCVPQYLASIEFGVCFLANVTKKSQTDMTEVFKLIFVHAGVKSFTNFFTSSKLLLTQFFNFI